MDWVAIDSLGQDFGLSKRAFRDGSLPHHAGAEFLDVRAASKHSIDTFPEFRTKTEISDLLGFTKGPKPMKTRVFGLS